MGGSSSNAACFFEFLNTQANWDMTTEELSSLSVRFGSDIPFFLYQSAAIVAGVGESVTPIPLETEYYVLVLPSFGISTQAVYQTFDKLALGHDHDTQFNDITAATKNDLFTPACVVEPKLNALVDECKQLGFQHIRLSGSGSTLFINTQSESESQEIKQTLESNLSTPVTIMTCTSL